jgi:hypothetical protein
MSPERPVRFSWGSDTQNVSKLRILAQGSSLPRDLPALTPSSFVLSNTIPVSARCSLTAREAREERGQSFHVERGPRKVFLRYIQPHLALSSRYKLTLDTMRKWSGVDVWSHFMGE